jgi:hypothetical protein
MTVVLRRLVVCWSRSWALDWKSLKRFMVGVNRQCLTQRRKGTKGKMKTNSRQKFTAFDIEMAVSRYFNPRANLIVPNVSWGLFGHEVDLCVLSKNNYASEIEIKISRADLIKDKLKSHCHNDPMIKYLYFAIPEYLLKDIEHIPERAGILVVEWIKPWSSCYGTKYEGRFRCKKHRNPKANGFRQWEDYERNILLRLGCMRIWGLKKKLMTYEQNQN